MDKDKEKWISADAECDKSMPSGTKPAKVLYSATKKSPHVYILTPVNTNTAKHHSVSPSVPSNTSNVLTQVIIPNHINSNFVNLSSEPYNATEVSQDIIVINCAHSERAAVQQHILNVSRESVLDIVAALLQYNAAPVQSENTEIGHSEIQQTIASISHVVEWIFATSNEGILITFPCTPGFETEKVSPANRITVKHGPSSSFGLSEECALEKIFNIIFHHLSADFLSNLSTESEIKRFICYAMHALMEVMPVEYALTLVCNCSLCWFLYMCAKVIYRDSPEESRKLNWSGCPISSYKCLAMRRIVITDVNCEADAGQDSSVNCCFSLQLRFTRGGQKRKLHEQKEHFKAVKRNVHSLGSDVNKVSKIMVRAGVTAGVPNCSFSSLRSGRSVKNTGHKFKGCPKFQSPEDVYVFNPVRQFKGNTYTRRKNSGVR
jgi:hypothetical protein